MTVILSMFFFFLMLEGFQGPQTGKQLTWTVFDKENKRIPRNGRSWSIVWHVFLLFVFCSLIFGNKLCRNLNRSLSSYQNSSLVPRLRRIKKRRRILYPWILIRCLMFYTPQPRIHEWILRIRNLLYHSILSTVSKGTKIRHGSRRQWKGDNGAIKTWRGSKNNMVLVDPCGNISLKILLYGGWNRRTKRRKKILCRFKENPLPSNPIE